MSFSQVVVRVSAALFLLLGLSFLFMPEFMASKVGMELTSTTAKTEVRATYGGLEIGLACFLLLSSFHRDTLRAAIVALICCVSGYISGRIIGIAMDGSPTATTWFMLIFEILWLGMALNAFFFLWKDGE
jgi:hypothetical protein